MKRLRIPHIIGDLVQTWYRQHLLPRTALYLIDIVAALIAEVLQQGMIRKKTICSPCRTSGHQGNYRFCEKVQAHHLWKNFSADALFLQKHELDPTIGDLSLL
jgi:hypothetical protein